MDTRPSWARGLHAELWHSCIHHLAVQGILTPSYAPCRCAAWHFFLDSTAMLHLVHGS